MSLLTLLASPRKGNSDFAAQLFMGAQQPVVQQQATRLALREHNFLPCIACGACTAAPHHCMLAHKDAVEEAFYSLQQASALCIAAPIFFYHLPAQCKALIDRAQRLWMAKEAGASAPPMLRPAWLILTAARPRGEQLFTGSILTVKLFLDALGFSLAAEPLLLFNLEAADALETNAALCEQVVQYGLTAGQQMQGRKSNFT